MDLHADQRLAARVARHSAIEAEIRGSSDEELQRSLSGPELLERGRATVSLPGGDVFVKLLPLTALESQPEHLHSTRNLFELPAHYHYRIGSCGFGAWRELEVHRIANRWVLSGDCPSFPLLHAWRVLPIVGRGDEDLRDTARWREHPAIRRRVASIEESTSSVALFLEHFPMTLGQWFRTRTSAEIERALQGTEADLLGLLAFTAGQGLLHLDAHFENILTDGRELFLADHGLALSRSFRLAPDESAFFEAHENFDRCTAVTSHVHALVTHYDAREDWRRTLRELTEQGHPDMPDAVRSQLLRRGPVALAMGDFYGRLTADLATEYPAATLQQILDRA